MSLLICLCLVVYQFSNDELVEDDNLQIIGETDPTDLSSDSDDEETSAVPVRLLTDFSLYNLETRQLVPVAELLQIQYGGSTVYAASGTVKPYVEDDEEDEDEVVDDDEDEGSLLQDGDDVQVVRLSKIMEFDIHNVSSRKKRLDRYGSLSVSHMFVDERTVKCICERSMHGIFSTCHQLHIRHSSPASGYNTGSCTS
jgi:hypothetical protein